MHAQTWASYSALYRFGRLSLTDILSHTIAKLSHIIVQIFDEKGHFAFLSTVQKYLEFDAT